VDINSTHSQGLLLNWRGASSTDEEQVISLGKYYGGTKDHYLTCQLLIRIFLSVKKQ